MEPFVRLKTTHLTLAPPARLLKQADYQIFVDASQLLDTARREVEDARQEIEREREQERALGYQEGQTQAHLELAERMLDTAERTVDYLGRLEHRVVDLVMLAVQKILGEFDDIELTRRLVRQALEVVRNQPRATIRICSAQAVPVRERLHELLAGHAALGMVEVVADARLTPGGCILETEIGVVEASLETQLQALEQALRARLQQDTKDTKDAASYMTNRAD